MGNSSNIKKTGKSRSRTCPKDNRTFGEIEGPEQKGPPQAVAQVVGDSSDLLDRFKVVVDDEAEPTDFDSAVANFLLRVVEGALRDSSSPGCEPDLAHRKNIQDMPTPVDKNERRWDKREQSRSRSAILSTGS